MIWKLRTQQPKSSSDYEMPLQNIQVLYFCASKFVSKSTSFYLKDYNGCEHVPTGRYPIGAKGCFKDALAYSVDPARTPHLIWSGLRLPTVDSRYLEFQGTLWNTSRYPYFDISDLRNSGKQLIEQPPLTDWICNLTPELKIYWKYCGRGEIAPKEQFLLFSTILCCLLVDLYVKTGTRFRLRVKRLFEISEVEITRVDCILVWVKGNCKQCIRSGYPLFKK